VDEHLRLAQLASSVDTANILIRELQDSDSIEKLTELLHRAYRRLLDMGLRYWATHQTVDETRTRIAGGRCLVAVLDGRIVGTVTYEYPPHWRGTQWYMRTDVACVSQFAVEPECQRRGIGSALMKRVEGMATEDGATELALNTAEPAAHLIDYYAKRGYRVVEHTDATLPHYRSVILSKRLIETEAKAN
jgi:GNAT superfamily N-acetyltransferase